MAAKEQILINCDPKTKAKVKKDADAENRSVTGHIIHLIENYKKSK